MECWKIGTDVGYGEMGDRLSVISWKSRSPEVKEGKVLRLRITRPVLKIRFTFKGNEER